MVVKPHPFPVECRRHTRRSIQTRVRPLFSRELRSDNPQRVRVDPQRDPVGTLVIAPFLCVVPEWIRVLSWVYIIAEDRFEPCPIPLFSAVVFYPMSSIEHKKGQVKSGK